MIVRMAANGRLIIPSVIRRKLGMTTRTRVCLDVVEQTHRIVLIPITRERILGLRAKYRGKSLLKALMAGKLRRSKSADR